MKEKVFDYPMGDVVGEGFMVHEDSSEKLPCVLVCHAWGGQSEYERNLAREFARLGFAGFAVDIYGKGVRGDPFQGNEALMKPFIEDRRLLQAHMLAAVAAAKADPHVDAARLAVFGLCFGGLCALDLARSSVPGVLGAVSVHGVLDAPGWKQGPVSTKVLILHGFDDPVSPPEKVMAVARELTQAGADWQMHVYGHAMHAFSVPEANLPEAGILYHKDAARRARKAAFDFLCEILA